MTARMLAIKNGIMGDLSLKLNALVFKVALGGRQMIQRLFQRTQFLLQWLRHPVPMACPGCPLAFADSS